MVGLADQLVITRAFPPGAVIAALTQEHIQECVGIILIAYPAGSAKLIVEAGLGIIENLALDLPQLDLYPQFVPPHLLQLYGQFLLHLGAAARAGVEREL